MEFLASSLLWGSLAVAVPVVLHLVGRAKPVVHRFPAIRFVIRSQRVSSRVLRLKHLIVLLLRVLALVLIALALARPEAGGLPLYLMWAGAALMAALLAGYALYGREFALLTLTALMLLALYWLYPSQTPGRQELLRGDFVLVLDQSMSMAYQEPEGTRLELARREALALVERLAPDARVALLLAGSQVERAQGRLSLRHDLVRQRLLDVQPTGTALDLSKALQAAGEIIAREPEAARPRYVLLFTDLQANSINALAMRSAALPKNADGNVPPLIVVDVSSEEVRNGAAVAANLPAKILPAETVVTVNAKVRPPDKDRQCLIEIYVDDRRAAQMSLPPKGQDVVDLDFQFATGAPGPHVLRVNVADADRLPLDQNVFAAYTAGRPARALILERPSGFTPEGQPRRGSAFFLKAALQPAGSEQGITISGLNFDVEPLRELTKERLAAYKVVILADCGDLSDGSWSALQQWCDDGGGLFVWLGANHTPALTQRRAFQPHAKYQGLLPGTLINIVELKQPLPITIAQPEHPVLAHFNPGIVSVLRQCQVRKYLKIQPQVEDTAATTVLSLGDGSPLLLEKTYGRGRVLLCAIDPGADFSDLPRRAEAFVTLALDAVRLLAGQDKEVEARLGMPLVLTLPSVPADKLVYWRQPRAKDATVLRIESELDREPSRKEPAPNATNFASVIVPPLETIGVHALTWVPKNSPPQVRLLPLNADPGESDLTKAPVANALAALAGWRASVVKNLGSAAPFSALAAGDSGLLKREAAAILLLALLSVLLAEIFLGNRLYRNVDETAPAQPTEVPSGKEGPA